MIKEESSVWNNDLTQQLATVLSSIDDIDSMQNFLRDVMTKKEITEIGARLEAAQMLRKGAKYTEIVTATKLSSRTVARISDWLQNGTGGYDTALEIASTHHAHLPPARV
jgi:TrpR-related protein YerC/YecD